jgi:glucokinase
MIGPSGSDILPWLLVEASSAGVLRYATAMPSARPRIGNVREIDVTAVPTFTDALQQIERECGISLRGTRSAMAMAGATSGDSLTMVRARWTITRPGLRAIFEQPVTVLNDVAARAWAARASTATVAALRGGGMPNLERPGRYAMIMVEEGVGAAIVDVGQDGDVNVLETEAGHMDFAPVDENEFRLAEAIKGTNASTSWERVLMLDRHDPAWATACPRLTEPERPRLQCAALGRFSMSLMHSFGAWNGVMLTGARVSRILEAGGRPAFDASFAGRRNFSRLVMACPVWRVDQHEAVLTGLAERLAHEMEPALRAAA